MTQNPAAQLQQQLASKTGLSLDLMQRPSIAGFVTRRCQELGLDDELAYHRLALRDSTETERFVKEVSVAETWFFRYPASFELLIDHCSRLLRGGQQELRMLSIACSTGEEPFGMTMAALEANWPLERIAVDALDRHAASLEIARRASYREISFRETMPPWAQRWLRNVDAKRQVDPKVVARVRFLCDDVLNRSWTAGESTYDIVFCRNLFIYLGDSARAKLSRCLLSLLSRQGLLFVGHAETAIFAGTSFDPAGVKHTFALRHRAASQVEQASPADVGMPRFPPADRQRRNPIARAPKSVDPRRSPAGTRQSPTFEDACALADAGQLREAMAILDVIEPHHASQPDYFELLGNINLSLGQIQEAREAFTKVLYFEPDHEIALLQLAIIFDRSGNAEQASRFRRRAMHAHDRKQRHSSGHQE